MTETVTIEKQVWESTLNRSMELKAENEKLKEYERIVTSYNMKPIDYDIACETVNKLLDERKVLKEENAQLKEQINKYYLDAINRGTANTVKAVKEFGMTERIKELVKENAQLKERNDSLNNRDINLCRIANGIRDENFALKELLKECKEPLEVFADKKDACEWCPEDLLAKIDEVLR